MCSNIFIMCINVCAFIFVCASAVGNTIQQHVYPFQTGTVIEQAADFYHSRIPRKERKKTIVDELLADADFKRCVTFFLCNIFELQIKFVFFFLI